MTLGKVFFTSKPICNMRTIVISRGFYKDLRIFKISHYVICKMNAKYLDGTTE